MRTMGVKGLTLYHLKSHLQKFCLGRQSCKESTDNSKDGIINSYIRKLFSSSNSSFNQKKGHEFLHQTAASNDVVYYKRDMDKDVDTVGKTRGNHAVYGLKFRVLREFLQLGYGVLLSDVDIVFLQNPFSHLYRETLMWNQ